MDIEMAQDLATRLDVELNVVPTTWGTMMKDLGSRCDIAMGGISVTPDRAQHALYSSPYVRDGKAAIVRCTDRPKYGTLAQIDRPGVRVVVNPDGTNADFDKANIHHARIENFPDNNDIFGQVANNAADVMITDASEIRWQTKENPQLCGESVDHPFTVVQKAYLLPQSDPALQQWVDDWLKIAQHDGTYAAISKKWMGQTVSAG
jgi:cyclohexadienyl dehydratase